MFYSFPLLKIMNKIGQIIEGTINNVFNKNENLQQERMKICYKCPLYSSKFGGQCNNRLWLNVETGDISLVRQQGYIRGCGCVLNSKTRVPEAHCPAGKW